MDVLELAQGLYRATKLLMGNIMGYLLTPLLKLIKKVF